MKTRERIMQWSFLLVFVFTVSGCAHRPTPSPAAFQYGSLTQDQMAQIEKDRVQIRKVGVSVALAEYDRLIQYVNVGDSKEWVLFLLGTPTTTPQLTRLLKDRKVFPEWQETCLVYPCSNDGNIVLFHFINGVVSARQFGFVDGPQEPVKLIRIRFQPGSQPSR